jgi:cobalt-zinc-cadmium efflux system outer membrane protein
MRRASARFLVVVCMLAAGRAAAPAAPPAQVPAPQPPAAAPATPTAPRPAVDVPLRRIQATPTDGSAPGVVPPAELPSSVAAAVPVSGVPTQSLSLQAALYGALTSNPDLVTLRQGTSTTPSPESVEVARHFPTTLNPTLWFDWRPWTFIPRNETGVGGQTTGNTGATGNHKGFYKSGQQFFYFSYRQPIELGHQTTWRYRIAQAALDQQQWTVMQAELTTLVQAYRFFQTAAYRREKLHVAEQLADFNDRLVQSLQRRLEANQATPADVTLARVESRSAHQAIKVARQDYLTALTDLRNQIGRPESAATAEPFGEFTLPQTIPPIDEQGLLQIALRSRPDIHAAQAQVNGTAAAIQLAKADKRTTPVLGPVYEMDEAGVQYFGFVWIQPFPILNTGRPLVRQREAEHRRAHEVLRESQERTLSQVRSAIAKWNGAADLVNESSTMTSDLAQDVASMERIFEAGQTDLTKLMQARQRLIQAQNARLDAVWAATQAQSDLLLALGAESLLMAAVNQAETDASRPAAATGVRQP